MDMPRQSKNEVREFVWANRTDNDYDYARPLTEHREVRVSLIRVYMLIKFYLPYRESL